MKLNIDIKTIFLLPNLISLFRLFLGIIVGFIFLIIPNFDEIRLVLIIFIFLAYFSDLLDGFLARRKNCISEFGKIIDPVADKVFVFMLVLVLFLSGKLDSILFIAIIFRDFLILLGSYYFASKVNFVIPSNYLGKFTVFCIGLYLLILTFGLILPHYFYNFSKYFILILLTASLLNYFFNAVSVVKKG